MDERIREYDHAIAEIAREDARCRRLMKLPGIVQTSATALVSSIGQGHDGRQLAALPASFTPCTAKIFLARSIPAVIMLMIFPLLTV